MVITDSILRKYFWPNPIDGSRHLRTNAQRRKNVLSTIDRNGFNWRVVVAAGSAFFTSSYNLFAANVILPALQYLYYPNNWSLYLQINGLTLSGVVVGQLLFGFFADKFGRRKVHGAELVVIIFSAIGAAQSADGRDGSMSVASWVLFWRFMMGIGIGATFPLSAVITAEFASVRNRPRMMAAVFLMQPLGQLAASLVGLLVTIGLNSQYNGFPDRAVDQTWRAVIGGGAIPALFALILRFTMPESPRYTLDVANEAGKTLRFTEAYFHHHEMPSHALTEMEYNPPQPEISSQRVPSPGVTGIEDDWSMNQGQSVNEVFDEIESTPDQFSMRDLKQYFLVEGNWRYLIGTSLCWFFLDFALWGLGTNNPETLARIWNLSSNEDVSIYSRLGDYAKQDMLLVSVGAVVGSLLLLKIINLVSRRKILIFSFLCLAVLLAATGSIILATVNSSTNGAIIALYILCHVIFNLGPNTLIYIISAEIFPTRYRATCHGISAAAGTLGSIVVQVCLYASSSTDAPHWNRLGGLLLGSSALMISGAVLAWAWIPTLQSPRLGSEISQRPQDDRLILVSKTLEELGRGIAGARIDGDVIGISKNVKRILARLRIMKA